MFKENGMWFLKTKTFQKSFETQSLCARRISFIINLYQKFNYVSIEVSWDQFVTQII